MHTAGERARLDLSGAPAGYWLLIAVSLLFTAASLAPLPFVRSWGALLGVDVHLALIGLKVFPVVILGGLDSILGAIVLLAVYRVAVGRSAA